MFPDLMDRRADLPLLERLCEAYNSGIVAYLRSNPVRLMMQCLVAMVVM